MRIWAEIKCYNCGESNFVESPAGRPVVEEVEGFRCHDCGKDNYLSIAGHVTETISPQGPGLAAPTTEPE